MTPSPLVDGDRLVVLARTIDAGSDPNACDTLEQEAFRKPRIADGSLSHQIFRQDSLFKEVEGTVPWTHLEIVAFEQIVPLGAIEAALTPLAGAARTLRTELLVATLGSYHGETGTPSQPVPGAVSVEYIDVKPDSLKDYREIMRKHCGPAAASAITAGKVRDFRALETITVLQQSDDLPEAWNQLHLFDLGSTHFDDFLVAFDEGLSAVGPDFQSVFGHLDTIRTMRRWTFSTAVGGR